MRAAGSHVEVQARQFEVCLLGPFKVRFDDVAIDVAVWRPQVARLFRLIACSPDLRRSRDEIVDLLWPDALLEAGARNLGFALHMLRRSLDADPSPILSEHGWIVLNPAYEWKIDLQRFEVLAHDGLARTPGGGLESLEHAARLFGGEPLPLDRYEDWAQPVRDRVQRAWRDICLRTAQLQLDSALYDEAIGWIERALESDPLDEEALRFLLLAMQAAGRRTEALRRYNQFADLLRNELDVEPSPETLELQETMRTEVTGQTATPRPRNNLPEPTTRILGRAREIAAVTAFFRRDDVRLVTLHGTGGTGKTRLALEVGRSLLDEFPDGVFLISLASLADSSLVVHAIGQVFDISESGEQPLIDVLIASIGTGQMLLILDNFEHLMAAAAVVSQLLAACGNLKVLVTSRQRLHLTGEHSYPVPPLDVPTSRSSVGLELLASIPAVQLFVRRAEASDPDFTLDADNAAAVAAICRRLDGLPLAIELAAARVVLLPPSALLARLEDAVGRTSLQLLSGGATDLPPRQQSLRSTIGWSYDLLDSEEQRLFRCLSAFAGGCTMEAAEVVYGGSDELPVLEGVESLMGKSLVLRLGAGREPRYFMLETLHAYAEERLQTASETDAVRRKHAKYFLDLAIEADDESKGPNQTEWLDRLEHEHNNLRAALRWCLDTGEADMAVRLGGAIWGFWWTHGHLAEGRRWLDEIMARCTAASLAQRYLLLNGAGAIASTQGDYERAAAHFGEILRLYLDAANEDASVHGLTHIDLLRGTASALNNLGIVAGEQGEHDRAAALYEEALPLVREMGNQYGVAVILNNLGVVASAQNDFQRAEHHYEESLAIRRQLGDTSGIGMTLTNLAEVVAQRGDHLRALQFHADGLEIGHQIGDMRLISACLEGIAVSLIDAGKAEQAARLLGASATLRASIGNPVPPTEQGRYDGWLQLCAKALGSTNFETAWHHGKQMELEEVVQGAIADAVKQHRGTPLPKRPAAQERKSEG